MMVKRLEPEDIDLGMREYKYGNYVSLSDYEILLSLLRKARPYLLDSAHEWQNRPDHEIHRLLAQVEAICTADEAKAHE
jgi:hypothetical protein